MAVKIDGESNKIKVQTNFSTLSLTPQELLSFIVDFNNRILYLKQKDSCKFYELRIGKNIAKLPNVAELFDLWPYVMFYN